MSDETPQNPPTSAKPRFLLKGSPLVAGGKARLMSNRKVEPNRAKPRDVSKVEAQGYTEQPHKALPDEPECVGPAILDGYAESARFYESLQHLRDVEAAQQSRKLLTAEQRLLDAQARAKRTQTDFSHEFHICRNMIDRAKRGGRKEPPAAVRVLEKVEAALDGTHLDGIHTKAA